MLNKYAYHEEEEGHYYRDVGDGRAGWAIDHPGLGWSVNPILTTGGQIVPPTLLLAHPALGSFLYPCLTEQTFTTKMQFYTLS